MSLLTDLESIDLPGIVDARTNISASVNTDDLNAIISGGATVWAVLGDFGASIQQLRGGLDDPQAFVKLLWMRSSRCSARSHPTWRCSGGT